jgi:transposase
MVKARKKYSLEFKISAVTMSNQCGDVLYVAKELNISKNTLQHWKKFYKEGKFTFKRSSASDTTRNELLRLRKEIKELKIERDILKKALSIFSRRDG